MNAHTFRDRVYEAAPDLLMLARQYLLDMLHPPAAASRERRIEAIEAVLNKIGTPDPEDET